MVKCNVYKKQISYPMLNKSIDIYKRDTGKTPNYLIMNYHTFTEMRWDGISDCHGEVSLLMNYMNKKEYHGIPIAIADHLEDGMVDIV